MNQKSWWTKGVKSINRKWSPTKSGQVSEDDKWGTQPCKSRGRSTGTPHRHDITLPVSHVPFNVNYLSKILQEKEPISHWGSPLMIRWGGINKNWGSCKLIQELWLWPNPTRSVHISYIIPPPQNPLQHVSEDLVGGWRERWEIWHTPHAGTGLSHLGLYTIQNHFKYFSWPPLSLPVALNQ